MDNIVGHIVLVLPPGAVLGWWLWFSLAVVKKRFGAKMTTEDESLATAAL